MGVPTRSLSITISTKPGMLHAIVNKIVRKNAANAVRLREYCGPLMISTFGSAIPLSYAKSVVGSLLFCGLVDPINNAAAWGNIPLALSLLNAVSAVTGEVGATP